MMVVASFQLILFISTIFGRATA